MSYYDDEIPVEDQPFCGYCGRLRSVCICTDGRPVSGADDGQVAVRQQERARPGVMYSLTYDGRWSVVWTHGSESAEVRDQNGWVLHRGTHRECLQFLADQGNQDARRELSRLATGLLLVDLRTGPGPLGTGEIGTRSIVK